MFWWRPLEAVVAFQTENSGQERGEEDWIRFNLHETGGHLLQQDSVKEIC